MPNLKSASKRSLINRRNRLENRFYKSSVRTLIKAFLKNLEIYKNSQINEDKMKLQLLLNSLYSSMDKGCKKNIFHKNKAARKKSKLALQFKIIQK
ncbi:MAG: 30S ribosomal protein S20 [Acidimicrobiales bacterium]